MSAKQVPTIKVLRAAKRLLPTKRRWTTDSYATDKLGHSTGPEKPDAVCFCWMGAIYAAAAKLGLDRLGRDCDPLEEALNRLARRRYRSGGLVGAFLRVNDDRGYEAALAIVNDAIAELEAAP